MEILKASDDLELRFEYFKRKFYEDLQNKQN